MERLRSVEVAGGDFVHVLRVIWAVDKHVLAFLHEVLDLVSLVFDLSLDLSLEADVVDEGLLDVLAVAASITHELLSVALLKDPLGVDKALFNQLFHAIESFEPTLIDLGEGFEIDGMSAFFTVLAHSWKRIDASLVFVPSECELL